MIVIDAVQRPFNIEIPQAYFGGDLPDWFTSMPLGVPPVDGCAVWRDDGNRDRVLHHATANPEWWCCATDGRNRWAGTLRLALDDELTYLYVVRLMLRIDHAERSLNESSWFCRMIEPTDKTRAVLATMLRDLKIAGAF